jgi:hypothetical protein
VIVIADTGPLNYLVLIGSVDMLSLRVTGTLGMLADAHRAGLKNSDE